MRDVSRALTLLLIVAIGAAQSQVQSIDSTDSERQRREKTNANFTFLNNKITTAAAAKENPLTFSGPLNRAGNTIQCPTCLAGEINSDGYASLSAAVAAIGANPATLTISSAKSVTSDLTIPANVATRITGTGSISVSNAVILTIKGPLDAPLRQIFTGVGTVRFGAQIAIAYPQFWGAKLDGTTDDFAAIQKAIDAWTHPVYPQLASGCVEITGPTAISSTLNLFGKGILLKGRGAWGSSGFGQDGSTNDYIRWIGSAGSPMILVHAMGARIEGLHLIGKSSAKPSAAIEFSEDGSYFGDNLCVRDVWVGPMYGADDDTGIQFTRGIYFSGTLDGDTNLLERLFVVNCTTGIEISNHNASINHFETVQTMGCGIGIKVDAAYLLITNWICASNDTDLYMDAFATDVSVHNYVSESSGRFVEGSGVGPHRLIVNGGAFQCDGNGKFATGQAEYSGKRAFIKFIGTAAIQTYIELHSFWVTQLGATAKPVIQAWGVDTDNVTPATYTGVQIKIDISDGITASMIDVGSDGLAQSSRVVEFTPLPRSLVSSQQTRFIQNSGYGSEDGSFEEGRYDLLSKVNVYGGPLKVKKLPTPIGVTAMATGSGATNYSYKVTALTHDGQTLASSAATCTNTTLDSTHYNSVAWYPVPGAYAFKVYGRTSGAELLLATVPVSQTTGNSHLWVDDGTLTPSGALPTLNTTGNAVVDGIFSAGMGAAVASASAIAPTGNTFHVTGTTTITSVSGTGITAGTAITIIFDGVLTFTDGSNLKLAGNFVTTADDTITLVWDGSNWYEKSRSVN